MRVQWKLRNRGDGLVSHEIFDRVKRAVDRFEAAWDEGLTGLPFPFKDAGIPTFCRKYFVATL